MAFSLYYMQDVGGYRNFGGHRVEERIALMVVDVYGSFKRCLMGTDQLHSLARGRTLHYTCAHHTVHVLLSTLLHCFSSWCLRYLFRPLLLSSYHQLKITG